MSIPEHHNAIHLLANMKIIIIDCALVCAIETGDTTAVGASERCDIRDGLILRCVTCQSALIALWCDGPVGPGVRGGQTAARIYPDISPVMI